METIVDTLCNNMVSEKEQLRDISSIALKTVINELPPGASVQATSVCRRIIVQLCRAISMVSPERASRPGSLGSSHCLLSTHSLRRGLTEYATGYNKPRAGISIRLADQCNQISVTTLWGTGDGHAQNRITDIFEPAQCLLSMAE